MFKKKPNIKPLSPLRSSDRRKLAEQIIREYKIEFSQPPAVQDPTNKIEAASSSNGSESLSKLRGKLLPDNSQYARFMTTSGPDQKQISGTVYVGAHSGEEQRVLWIKIEESHIPSVYTLWHNPRLVPLLHTPSLVMTKLHGGADLMTPGLAGGPPFPSTASQGAVVAVASIEQPTVPLFIGRCVIDVAKLGPVQGQKGRAVEGIHWYGDEIWGWSTSSGTGREPPDSLGDGTHESEGDSYLGSTLDNLKLAKDQDAEEEAGGTSLPNGESHEGQNNIKTRDEGLLEVVEDEEPPTTKEIDEAFRKAFLYGLHHYKNTNRTDSTHGLSFPLSSSFVMSHLVLPFLPTHTQTQTESLQMKKTSWKSIKKFIKYLDKQMLVKSKERNGGETVILDIDFEDRAVSEFVPYRLPKKEQSKPSTSEDNTKAGSSPHDASVGQTLKRNTLYRPKDRIGPLFAQKKHSTKASYQASEIRQIVTEYIESESLISSTNKRQVQINPVLANAVFNSKSVRDSEIVAAGQVARDTLMDKIIMECCSTHWTITSSVSSGSPQPKAGTPPQIQIVLETRTGNKTVTRVSGVETYLINPNVLADELQKACASSTRVHPLVGSSPKSPIMDILVQGPQTKAIIKSLEKRGVQRMWVDTVDKTKKKR